MRVFGSLVGDGAVSLLNYARRIMQVPVGLMGQAAAVASYPFLVSLLTNGEKERFDQTLTAALRASVGLIIPCALWMGVAAQPIMVIFQGGRLWSGRDRGQHACCRSCWPPRRCGFCTWCWCAPSMPTAIP